MLITDNTKTFMIDLLGIKPGCSNTEELLDILEDFACIPLEFKKNFNERGYWEDTIRDLFKSKPEKTFVLNQKALNALAGYFIVYPRRLKLTEEDRLAIFNAELKDPSQVRLFLQQVGVLAKEKGYIVKE